MTRREAISAVSMLLGGAVIGGEMFVRSCSDLRSDNVNILFEKERSMFLNEIAETILPETSTPGAKAANVGEFMAVMVRDCYSATDQEVFVKGLQQLNKVAEKSYDKDFMECDADQKKALLTSIEVEQKEYNKNKKENEPNHYFYMMKQLTLLGYFTSEVGATNALRYVAVPGRYDGSYPYKKGDRAWATT